MASRRGPRAALVPLVLAALHTAASLDPVASASATNSQQKQEIPEAAAHKQIVYRYIPIDKTFKEYDRKYDEYYKTGPYSDTGRRDHSQTRYHGRLDSYDQLYNTGRREDYSDYYSSSGGFGSSGEVDTYSSYSRGDSLRNSVGHSHADTYDYSDYYNDDLDTTTKKPRRRVKKKKKPKSTSAKVLDFAEAVIKRIWSPRDDSGGHHGYKSHHKKKKKKKKRKRRRKFKWPRFITFDSVLGFLSYLFAIATVIGYILLLTLNAVGSDGWGGIFNRRSLDTSGAQLVNAEALRLLQLLDAAIVRYKDY